MPSLALAPTNNAPAQPTPTPAPVPVSVPNPSPVVPPSSGDSYGSSAVVSGPSSTGNYGYANSAAVASNPDTVPSPPPDAAQAAQFAQPTISADLPVDNANVARKFADISANPLGLSPEEHARVYGKQITPNQPTPGGFDLAESPAAQKPQDTGSSGFDLSESPLAKQQTPQPTPGGYDLPESVAASTAPPAPAKPPAQLLSEQFGNNHQAIMKAGGDDPTINPDLVLNALKYADAQKGIPIPGEVNAATVEGQAIKDIAPWLDPTNANTWAMVGGMIKGVPEFIQGTGNQAKETLENLGQIFIPNANRSRMQILSDQLFNHQITLSQYNDTLGKIRSGMSTGEAPAQLPQEKEAVAESADVQARAKAEALPSFELGLRQNGEAVSSIWRNALGFEVNSPIGSALRWLGQGSGDMDATPEQQIAALSLPGFPVPVVRARDASTMDDHERLIQLNSLRAQTNINKGLQSGHVSPSLQSFNTAFTQGNTPEHLHEIGYPVRPEYVESGASMVNQALMVPEFAAGGEISAATGLDSVANTAGGYLLRASSQVPKTVGVVASIPFDAASAVLKGSSNFAAKYPRILGMGAVTGANTALHLISPSLSLPFHGEMADYLLSKPLGQFLSPPVSTGLSAMSQWVGAVPKGIRMLTEPLTQGLDLAGRDMIAEGGNLLSSRASWDAITKKPMSAEELANMPVETSKSGTDYDIFGGRKVVYDTKTITPAGQLPETGKSGLLPSPEETPLTKERAITPPKKGSTQLPASTNGQAVSVTPPETPIVTQSTELGRQNPVTNAIRRIAPGITHGAVSTYPLAYLSSPDDPEAQGKFMALGIALGAAGAPADLGDVVKNTLFDHLFSRDPSVSRPGIDVAPIKYGTRSDLDNASLAEINRIDPTTGQYAYSNAQKQAFHTARFAMNGAAEIHILPPPLYEREIKAMNDRGVIQNPDVNSRGVTIDPNPSARVTNMDVSKLNSYGPPENPQGPPELQQSRILIRGTPASLDAALTHEMSHPFVNRMSIDDQDNLFNLITRQNDPNVFTHNYTKGITNYDHLPSEDGVANGTEPYVPELPYMTKEDMKREMITENLSGLFKGDLLTKYSRNSGLIRGGQMVLGNILERMGIDTTTGLSTSILGVKPSFGAAVVLDALARESMQKNMHLRTPQGVEGAMALPLDAPIDPVEAANDAAVIKGLIKLGYTPELAAAQLAMSKKLSTPNRPNTPKQSSPSEVAKGILVKGRGFTQDEADSHVPSDAKTASEAANNATLSILTERKAKGIPSPEEQTSESQAVDKPFVPSKEWQKVPEHIMLSNPEGSGMELKLDSGGGKLARWDNPPGQETILNKRTGKLQDKAKLNGFVHDTPNGEPIETPEIYPDEISPSDLRPNAPSSESKAQHMPAEEPKGSPKSEENPEGKPSVEYHPTGTIRQRSDGTWALHVGMNHEAHTPFVRLFRTNKAAEFARDDLQKKYGAALMDHVTSDKLAKPEVKPPAAAPPEAPKSPPKPMPPEAAHGGGGSFEEAPEYPGPGTEITSKGVTEHGKRKGKSVIGAPSTMLPQAPVPSAVPPVAQAGVATVQIPQVAPQSSLAPSAPVEPTTPESQEKEAPKEEPQESVKKPRKTKQEGATPESAPLQKHLREKEGMSPGEAHRTVFLNETGKAPRDPGGRSTWRDLPVTGVPAPIRYLNPSGMWDGPSARKFGSFSHGIISGGNHIAQFDTPEQGAAAQFDLLNSRSYVGKSVVDVVRKWTESKDENEIQSYANAIAKAGGISPDDIITTDFLKGKGGIELAKEQAKQESGKSFPMTDDQWRTAQAMAYEGVTGPSSSSLSESTGTTGSNPMQGPAKPATVQPSAPSAPAPVYNLPEGAQPVTARSIGAAEEAAIIAATNRTGAVSQPGTEAYDQGIQQHMFQSLGQQHLASLPIGDTRVQLQPDGGMIAGTHFVQGDAFHDFLLRGQTPEAMQVINHVQDAIAGKNDLFLNYGSAPHVEPGTPTGGQREISQTVSPPQAREKGLADIQEAGKHIIPTYMSVAPKAGESNTVTVGGVSPDKIIENSSHIAHELGPKSPYPPMIDKGSAHEDLRGYLSNVSNGVKGSGEGKLTPLPGHEEDVPQTPTDFTPYPLGKKASFWNLAINGPDSRMSQNAKSAPKSAKAFELSKLNEGYAKQGYTNPLAHSIDMAHGPMPVMVKDRTNPDGPKIPKLDKSGKPVTQLWTQGTLHSGYERINVPLIKTIHADGEEGAPAIHVSNEAATKALQEKGLPPSQTVKAGFMPGELKSSTPADFIKTRDKTTRAGYLSPLAPEDIKDHKLYVNDQGTVGAAVDPHGDVQNVFNNSGPKGAGADAVAHAIKHGGKTLDAFDDYLPKLYRQFGFQETGRMKFNPDYAPQGWDYAKDDNPDVVFMAHKGYPPGGPEAAIERAKGDKSNWIKNEQSNKYEDNYDAAKSASRRAVHRGGTEVSGAHGETGRKASYLPAETPLSETGERHRGSTSEGRAISIGNDQGETNQTDQRGSGIAADDTERLGAYRQALQEHQGATDRIDRAFRQGGKPHSIDVAAEESSKQIPALRRLAEARGELLQPMEMEPDASGAEHHVWFSDDGKTVTKETYYRDDPAHGERKRFGAVPTTDAVDVRDATPHEYLDRIGINNDMDRKTRVVGVVDQGNGETRIRTEEPAISDAVSHPSMDEIAAHMHSQGFEPQDWKTQSWHNPKTKVLASDAAPHNFLKTDHGIEPVDLMLRHANNVASRLTDQDRLAKNEQQRSQLLKQQAKLDTTKPEDDQKWDILASKIHDLEREHDRLSESVKSGLDDVPRGTKAGFMPGDLLEHPETGERETVAGKYVKFPSGNVYTHPTMHALAQADGIANGEPEDSPVTGGYISSTGRLMSDEEGWALAKANKQLKQGAKKISDMTESEKAKRKVTGQGRSGLESSDLLPARAAFMPGDTIERNGERERIKSPAVKFPTGEVYEGEHHPDAQDNGIKDGHFAADAVIPGYTTEPTDTHPDGRFVGMKEGWKIGKQSSQLHPDVDPNKGFLNSEDLVDYPHPEDREPTDTVTQGSHGQDVRETSDYDQGTNGSEMVRYREPKSADFEATKREPETKVPFDASKATYVPAEKAYFMPSDNSLPVEYAKNKDGSPKLDKKGKPKPVKINFDLSKAPCISNKQPEDRMPEDAPNTMKSFDYLSENQQKQLSYQDRVSATGTLAKRAAVQLKKWMDDPEIAKGKDWYESMRGKLAKAFGDDREMFSHLLGVTSPMENPHDNFLYALEAYERLQKGDFARHIDLYKKAHDMMKSGDLVNHVEELTGKEITPDKNGDKSDAEAMAQFIHHHDILPERENGKLYSTHGNGILRAISELWADEPGAPKTKNYAGNLLGTTNAATIDSWAARFVRQLGYDGEKQWRIQPKSETGVSDYDFAFAQRVFDKAAKSIGISPDAAQAIVWTEEKKLWEKNGWIKGMGAEASSLDTPFDIAHPEGPAGPRLTAVKTREILAQQRAAAAKVEKEEKVAAKKAAKLGPPIPSVAR